MKVYKQIKQMVKAAAEPSNNPYKVSLLTLAREKTFTYTIDGSPCILCSRDGYELLRRVWERDLSIAESFYLVLLNRANRVTGVQCISQGGVSGTVADPKIILATACLTLSSGIILAHNHPSGNLTASQADIELTKRIKDLAKLMEVQVLDHLILTPENRYFSFADEGML